MHKSNGYGMDDMIVQDIVDAYYEACDAGDTEGANEMLLSLVEVITHLEVQKFVRSKLN